jgi:hypothetical protein
MPLLSPASRVHLVNRGRVPSTSSWFPHVRAVTTRRLPCLVVVDMGSAGRQRPTPMPASQRPCPARAAGTVPIRTCTRGPARSGAAGGGAAGAAATPGQNRPTTPLAPGPARQLTASWRPEGPGGSARMTRTTQSRQFCYYGPGMRGPARRRSLLEACLALDVPRMSGVPTAPHGMIRASLGRSSRSTSSVGPNSCAACTAWSSPIRESPPPPVPSTAQPRASARKAGSLR